MVNLNAVENRRGLWSETVCIFGKPARLAVAFRKLWNSIRGTNNESESEKGSAATSTKMPAARHSGKQKPSVSFQTDSVPESRRRKKSALSREDKRLCQRLESLSVRSLLEIGVGDGQRSISLLQTLVDSSLQNTNSAEQTATSDSSLLYLAVDQFEMGGNPLTLREFHKQLREVNVKAQLLPMAVEAGLDRVLRTVGQVDLVLWSAEEKPTAQEESLLTRLSRSETLVFTSSDGSWTESRSGLMVTPPRRVA